MMKDNLDKVNIDDEEFLFDAQTFTSLDDNDEFPQPLEKDFTSEDFVNMGDEELDKLLHEIIASPLDEKEDENLSKPNEEPLTSLEEERALFEMEKHLEMEKLRLERQELENEKAKFERTKQEWENFRKLSEDSLQAEKEEYERQIKLDREKMYLEAKELVNSCASVREFLDYYNVTPDVSE